MKFWVRSCSAYFARRWIRGKVLPHSYLPHLASGILYDEVLIHRRGYSVLRPELLSSVLLSCTSSDPDKKNTGKGFGNPHPAFSVSPSGSHSFSTDRDQPSTSPLARASTSANSTGHSSSFPNYKNAFEESLQRLFQVPTLRVDLSPVKRPLMEGSVWFDSGKMKVSLISGICGNSREDVETRLQARAEVLAAEFNKGFKDPTTKSERDAQTVGKRIQSAVGTVLPQLLNHLDIQLHIKFNFDEDQVVLLDRHAKPILHEEGRFSNGNTNISALPGQETRTANMSVSTQFGSIIRCSIYMREVWETKMQWTPMASVTQESVSRNHRSRGFSSLTGVESNTLLQALQQAANAVEEVLLRKREDHYFECIREAELFLKEVSHTPFSFPSSSSVTSVPSMSYNSLPIPGEASMASVLRCLEPKELKSSILQSTRGAPLMLKVALKDEAGNLSACALPLSGGSFTLIRNKLHLSINFQYSCIQENGDVEEIPLEQPQGSGIPQSSRAEKSNAMTTAPTVNSPSSSTSVQSSMLPPPQRALRLLSALLPTLWYHLSTLQNQDDLHEHTLLSLSPYKELKSAFTAAMIVHAGAVLHDYWWTAYCAVRKISYPPIHYVSLCTSNKKTLEKYEEKLSTILGWREAPLLRVVKNASLISFAVSDSQKRVLALGVIFDSVDYFSSVIGGEEFVSSRAQVENGKKPKGNSFSSSSLVSGIEGEELDGEGMYDLSSSSFSGLPSFSPPCQMDIIAVEETLRAIGVTSGTFDNSTSTLELTIEKKNDEHADGTASRTLTFSQLNEPSGIARLFRYCQKSSPKKAIFQTVRMDTAGSTYCRRVQRLLALVFRKNQVHKPGLRGKWLPIPVPFTSKFLVLSFTSNLQREMFSLTLLTTLEPFCRIPPDYPSFQWPACRLPAPCFFNFWGPTKKLLHRLGPYYYCSIEATSPTQQSTGTSLNYYSSVTKSVSSQIDISSHESRRVCDRSGNSNGEVEKIREEEMLDKNNKNKESVPLFFLFIYSGNSSSLDEEAYRLPLHGCTHASELPITVLIELDRLVCEQTHSAHAKKTQFERLQKMLCDRAVPREITLSSTLYWSKVIRLLYDSQEYYVRHQNQYKLLLELSPTLKTAELAVIDVFQGTDEEWKNALAKQYAEKQLLPLLDPVSVLYTRGLKILEKIPSPPPPNNAAGKQLKFFSINIRADLKQNNFHGSLSAGSSSFRKDTIQGLPSATPTAALDSLLDEIDETDEKELLGLGQQVYHEITSGVAESEINPFTTLANNSKLICSLELSAAQETLSPYLSDLQMLLRLKRDLKAISHEYHWASETLKIMATTNIAGDPPVELASNSCKWDEIPIILPQLYTKLTRKEGGKYRKTPQELERAMTKGAVAMLEYEVRTRIVPVMGTEKLFQNIRVVQIIGENMWYAELRLPAGLLKIKSIGEPRIQSISLGGIRGETGIEKGSSPVLLANGKASPSGFASPPSSLAHRQRGGATISGKEDGSTSNQKLPITREVFYVCCSTNTKRGALRKILSEFYRLYVACVDTKITLFGGQAPSSTAPGTAVADKKPAPAKAEKKSSPARGSGGGGTTNSGSKLSSNSFGRHRIIPPFLHHPNSPILGSSASQQKEGGSTEDTHSLPSGKAAALSSSSSPHSLPVLGVKEITPVISSSTNHGSRAEERKEETGALTSDFSPKARKVARPGQSSKLGNTVSSSSSLSSSAATVENGSTSPGARSCPYSSFFSSTSNTPRKVIRPKPSGVSSLATFDTNKNCPLPQRVCTPAGKISFEKENTSAKVPSTSSSSLPQKGTLVVPRKVKRPQANASSLSTSSTSTVSQPPCPKSPPSSQEYQQPLRPSGYFSSCHSSLVSVIMDELQNALSSSSHSSCTCVLRLSHRLGARLFCRKSSGLPPSSSPGGITAPTEPESLISQSLWSPTTLWQPFQLLQFFIKCLCQESMRWASVKDPATHWALLQELCQSIRQPNTVLEPSMPAKHFCVFFFHRYFGWPACDMEDVSHILAASRTGSEDTHQLSILVISEVERQGNKAQSWIGSIKLVQSYPGTSEFIFCEVLSSSCPASDPETAVTEAWESCMVKIITSFSFDVETNIYLYSSLDNSVMNAIRQL